MAFSLSFVTFTLPRRCPTTPVSLLSVAAAASHHRRSLQASRRFPNHPQQAVVVVPGARPWISGEEHNRADAGGEDDDEEEDDDDRSMDLLARFVHNMFRKVSRRARKAVRSVLPSIPTDLVSFSVNGVLMLAFLWILKSFLEVVCTIGSIVFVSILLIRGIWSGVSYIRENNYYTRNRMDDDWNLWNGVQTAT